MLCKPFDKFRRFIWAAMAVCLAGCFTLLADFFELQSGDARSTLVAAVLLIMTPTVFFAIQRVFDWGDRVVAKIRQIFRPKKRREQR